MTERLHAFDNGAFDALSFDVTDYTITSDAVLQLPVDCIMAGDVRNFKRWTAPFESAWLKIFKE